MHAHLHVASILFKRFLPHSNMLKYPGSLKIGSFVTKCSSCFASLFASFYFFILLWTHSDSLSSKELSSTITLLSDSPSSVEQTCDKFSSAGNSFDSLLSVEKFTKSKSVAYQSFKFLQGKCTSWEHQLSSHTLQAVLLSESNCQWDHIWDSPYHNFYKALFQTPL